MNNKSSKYLHQRVSSFCYAIAGIIKLLQQEPNMRIHAVAAIMVTVLGLIKGLTHWQWAAIVISIGIVLITESINTCIEMLCNMVCKNHNPTIKIIKDMAAGSVLLAACASAVTGIIIFIL